MVELSVVHRANESTLPHIHVLYIVGEVPEAFVCKNLLIKLAYAAFTHSFFIINIRITVIQHIFLERFHNELTIRHPQRIPHIALLLYQPFSGLSVKLILLILLQIHTLLLHKLVLRTYLHMCMHIIFCVYLNELRGVRPAPPKLRRLHFVYPDSRLKLRRLTVHQVLVPALLVRPVKSDVRFT